MDADDDDWGEFSEHMPAMLIVGGVGSGATGASLPGARVDTGTPRALSGGGAASSAGLLPGGKKPKAPCPDCESKGYNTCKPLVHCLSCSSPLTDAQVKGGKRRCRNCGDAKRKRPRTDDAPATHDACMEVIRSWYDAEQGDPAERVVFQLEQRLMCDRAVVDVLSALPVTLAGVGGAAGSGVVAALGGTGSPSSDGGSAGVTPGHHSCARALLLLDSVDAAARHSSARVRRDACKRLYTRGAVDELLTALVERRLCSNGGGRVLHARRLMSLGNALHYDYVCSGGRHLGSHDSGVRAAGVGGGGGAVSDFAGDSDGVGDGADGAASPAAGAGGLKSALDALVSAVRLLSDVDPALADADVQPQPRVPGDVVSAMAWSAYRRAGVVLLLLAECGVGVWGMTVAALRAKGLAVARLCYHNREAKESWWDAPAATVFGAVRVPPHTHVIVRC
jgi:hypothetical protein